MRHSAGSGIRGDNSKGVDVDGGIFLARERPRGVLPWERKNLGPSQVRGSNETFLVVLASANLNTPVALRPPAVRPARPKLKRVRMTQAMRQEVLDRYATGDPTRVVAAAVGVSKTTVLTIVKQAGVTRSWGVRYDYLPRR